MQAELFEMSGSVIDASKIVKPQTGWMDHFRVTLRLDHLLIVGILALVLYVLVFSFGVEKGKRYAVEAQKAERERPQQQISQVPYIQPQKNSDILEKTKTEVPPILETEAAKENPSTLSEQLEGHFTIQLVTFTNRKLAEEKVELLKKKGYHGFIIPRGKFFQVCANAFKNVGEARAKLTKLQSEGFARQDAFIRPLNGSIGV